MVPETRLIKWEMPEICTTPYCRKSHFSYGAIKDAHFYKDGKADELFKEACYFNRKKSKDGNITAIGYVFYNQITITNRTRPHQIEREVTVSKSESVYNEKVTSIDFDKAKKFVFDKIKENVTVTVLIHLMIQYLGDDEILLTQLKGFEHKTVSRYVTVSQPNEHAINSWEI